MADPVRLQKLLSAAGVASRRQAEELIRQGRVTVDGRPVTELGTKVDPDTAQVQVDGRLVRPLPAPLHLVMNKPRGTVCSERDHEGRQRVHDLLPRGLPRLFTVGRLDYDSEGVLLFTTDGDLARALVHPSSALPRIYQVKIQGEPDPDLLRRFNEGLRLEDGTRTRPAPTELVEKTRTNAWYEVVLTEGKNRQIHRMAAVCGRRVLKIRRIRFGPIGIEGIRDGRTRPLTDAEVQSLYDAVEAGAPERSAEGAPERPGRRPGRPQRAYKPRQGRRGP